MVAVTLENYAGNFLIFFSCVSMFSPVRTKDLYLENT